MKILVTGGTGLVGTNIGRYLVEQGDEVILYGRHIRDWSRALMKDALQNEKAKFVIGDILDPLTMLETIRKDHIESIIHTAFPLSNAKYRKEDVRMAIEGTTNVCEAARVMDLGRVTFTSTGGVYPPGHEAKEDSQYAPADSVQFPWGFYGATKIATELLGLQYAEQYGVDYVVARIAVQYGPGCESLPEGNLGRNPLVVFLQNALAGKPTEMAEGGDQKLEFTYVKDTARGTVLVHKAKKLKHRIYNISSGAAFSVLDASKAVKEAIPEAQIKVGSGVSVRAKWMRPPMDITRARDEAGYTPEYDLVKGVKAYVKWIKGGKW